MENILKLISKEKEREKSSRLSEKKKKYQQTYLSINFYLLN